MLEYLKLFWKGGEKRKLEGVNKKIVDAIYNVSKTDIRQFTKIIERMQGTMALNNVCEPDVEIVELAASLVMRRGGRAA